MTMRSQIFVSRTGKKPGLQPQDIFRTCRMRVLATLGEHLNSRIVPAATIDMPRPGFATARSLQRTRAVDAAREVPAVGGLSAPFELQCLPLYLLAVYIFYPHPGLLAFAVAMAFLTIGAELMTRRLANAAYEAVLVRTAIADSNAQNQQMLKAMGFAGATAHWFVTYETRQDGAYTVIRGRVEGDSNAEMRLSIKGTHSLKDLNLKL